MLNQGGNMKSQVSTANPAIDSSRLEKCVLPPNGPFPNSPHPVIIYREPHVFQSYDLAGQMEKLFAENDWLNQWRNGVYPYHHYHSTGHECLGVVSGWAQIQFGGEDGILKTVFAHDVIAIPAGVAHKNVGSSDDFSVVGAYAAGANWDVLRGQPTERAMADKNIARLPLPRFDPVFGADGPLIRWWQSF
jgi:uncharacterized protein YjlB